MSEDDLEAFVFGSHGIFDLRIPFSHLGLFIGYLRRASIVFIIGFRSHNGGFTPLMWTLVFLLLAVSFLVYPT